MVAMPVADREAMEEYRRRERRTEAILRAASENHALIQMAVEAAEAVLKGGTESWPTLEELEREFGFSG